MMRRGIPQPAAGQHRPRVFTLAIAVCAALMLLAAGPRIAAASSAKAEVSGSVDNGHGRLVFSFTPEIDAKVRQAGNVLVISFDKPVDVAIERIPQQLQGYVSIARRDPDGRAVRLALSRRVKVNTMPAAERLFVDLLPDSWTGLPPGLPQEVVDELARRAREAEERLRQAQRVRERPAAKPVMVRVATMPTFTRFLFPVPANVEVMTSHGNERLDLVFAAPLTLDFSQARPAAIETVSGMHAEVDGERTRVTLELATKVDIRTFREDGAFALDLSPLEAEPPARPRPPGRQMGEADEAPAAAPPDAAPARSAQRSAAATPAPAAPSAPAKPAAPASRQAAASEAPPARPAAAAPAAQGSSPGARLVQQGEVVRLQFTFPNPTAAAIFPHADALWLVFDTATPIDLGGLTGPPGSPVRDAVAVASGEGQAVRIRLAGRRTVTAVADGASWVVAIGDARLDPPAPLAVARTASPQGGPEAVVPFDQPQRVHRLVDPESGGALLVATGLGPARGLPWRYEFVEFAALRSIHGVVIAPLADDVTATLEPDRVLVRRPTGLALTPATGPSAPSLINVSRSPLDRAGWEASRAADFTQQQHLLSVAISEASASRRPAARIDLAQFLLANDRAGEAKGLLDLALGGERNGDTNPRGHLLRGLANIMLGRPEAAHKDLSAPGLGNQYGSALWRSVAMSRTGRFADAHADLQQATADPAGLPPELQRLAVSEAARCALEVGDLAGAARRLTQLGEIGVPALMRPEIELLSGRLAERLARPGDAVAAYRNASESRNEPAAAQARLRMIALRHLLGEASRESAITDLEILTAGWRGDDTEAEALGMLARLYVDEERYREAFGLMRTALAVHPRSRFTRTMQDEAAATFDGIFLGDLGGGLSPVEALGLFYDFSSLTPPGRRGDEMIRRLAERLVGMDLLSKASELLQHQIDHRLRGVARARIATRLAVIYLMDRKPDRALSTLRATRMNELPNDLRRQRLLLEARALADAGRHGLALQLVEHIEGTEVDRLRADIHWAARDWGAAAEEIERLYGERWQQAAPLDPFERIDMLRAAVGYALADDALGLARLRERYLEKIPEGPEQRMFAVVAAPLSGRSEDFAEIAKTASAVDTLTAFLRDLRKRYPDGGSAVSTAAPPERG